MKKLILLTIAVGSYMYGGIHIEADSNDNQSIEENYSWVVDTSDDNFKEDASRRRGKGMRNRRRGGGGLR